MLGDFADFPDDKAAKRRIRKLNTCQSAGSLSVFYLIVRQKSSIFNLFYIPILFIQP
jgi:hypothetical protein